MEMEKELRSFTALVETTLLQDLHIRSEKPHDPIRVKKVPKEWECIGTGNYAAVFMHQQHKEWVVKVYARDVEGLEKEAAVYEKLGVHPSYSSLLHKETYYLILQRLKGMTLYDAFHKGVRIPESVIEDINEALDYARKRGLNPYDVHGKNVMMEDGKGYVVDVSDFYKKGEDSKWRDLVRAYYKIYLPFFYKYPIPVPYLLLDMVRHSYRFYKKLRKLFQKDA
ncbi:serine/threonine protein kinase [Ectobacillus panaciterrae]|uniref:serine/threonine protein kinase n=1 Tax=Ectobacillus panaciterrae TaxID=363872 RepID=UPI00048CC928|nr:serine/threonine protein kinase [Ectobacillus panaciterrae]